MKIKGKSVLVIVILLISMLLSSTSYAYVISKRWSIPSSGSLDVYYSMSSNFSTDGKNSFSYANTSWNNAGGKIKIYRLTADNLATDASKNGKNEVLKKDLGSDYLALISYWTSSGKCVEFDIAWNSNSAIQWSNSGSSGMYDVQNCAAHELGHALFAGDVYNDTDVQTKYKSEYKDVTMYGYISTGETKKRSLHQDDIDGFKAAY